MGVRGRSPTPGPAPTGPRKIFKYLLKNIAKMSYLAYSQKNLPNHPLIFARLVEKLKLLRNVEEMLTVS